mgnify:CR=1 FL=1
MKPTILTRRRLLAGAGAAGLASVTGLSLLTDDALGYTHSATITGASEVSLQSDWRATHNGRVVSKSGDGVETTDDGATATVQNVLPGDTGTLSFQVTPESEDGEAPNVQPELTLELTETAENGLTEPERKAGDDDRDEGELQDYLEVEVWYDTGIMGVEAFGGDNGTQDPREGLVDPEAEGTLAEVADALDDIAIGGCLGEGEDPLAVTMRWEFPDEQEDQNVTQGDSVEFDVVLVPEQCDEGGGQ